MAKWHLSQTTEPSGKTTGSVTYSIMYHFFSESLPKQLWEIQEITNSSRATGMYTNHIKKKTLNDKLNPEMHSMSQTDAKKSKSISRGKYFNDEPVPIKSLLKMLAVKSKVFFLSWRYVIGCNCYSVQFIIIPNTVPMGVFCGHCTLYIGLMTALISFYDLILFTHIKDPNLTSTPTSFTQVGLAKGRWSGGYFHVTERKWRTSSDAIMDWVIKCTGTPEARRRLIFTSRVV